MAKAFVHEYINCNPLFACGMPILFVDALLLKTAATSTTLNVYFTNFCLWCC